MRLAEAVIRGGRRRSGRRGLTGAAMAKPDTIVVDGHAFSWQRLYELRWQQLEAWKAEQARQLALFELKTDYRPAAEQTAAGRYREPNLFDRVAATSACSGFRDRTPFYLLRTTRRCVIACLLSYWLRLRRFFLPDLGACGITPGPGDMIV
jgi:hypothetical protein